jgi:hypothetical protein
VLIGNHPFDLLSDQFGILAEHGGSISAPSHSVDCQRVTK